MTHDNCAWCEAERAAHRGAAITAAPTPRTDAEDRWQVDKDELGLTCRETVRIDVARELERENAQLRAALAELVRLLDAEDSPFERPQTIAVAEAWIAARAILAKGEGK